MSSGYEGRRNESYRAAWELAWDNLPIDALPEVAKATGSEFDGRTFHVRLLDRSASVDVETKEVCGDLPELDRFLSIVILHYLAGDHRAKPSEEWALFRQLPGGESFHGAFHKRVVEELARTFAEDPAALSRAGRRLCGRVEDFGSATVVLGFLPNLPVRVTVWQGDDEVPGNATMLFPASASRLLPTEDFAEVGAVVLAALRRASRLS